MDSPTKLFERDQVKKFFMILGRMDRFYTENHYYKGHYKINPDSTPCQKEVFVNRTIGKWLAGKYLIYYAPNKDTRKQYKQYLFISNVRFAMGYGDDIKSIVINYSNPFKLWEDMTVHISLAIDMEGQWLDNNKEHLAMSNMFLVDEPFKEYVYEMYDLNKMPKRVSNKNYDKAKENIKSSISFMAMTEYDAEKQKQEYLKDKKNVIIGELLEIKD